MKKFRRIAALSLLGMSFLMFNACQKGTVEPQEEQEMLKMAMSPENIVYCGTVKTVDFLAGQHIPAGSIIVGNDQNNLYVTFTTTGGWEMTETHLYVGACAAIPVNNAGNPAIGGFPYKFDHDPRVTSYTYAISLSELPKCMCVAAHAAVVKVENGVIVDSQTAWGKGDDMGGKSWAMKFTYCKQECTEEPPVEDTCYQTETAWANGTDYVAQGNWARYTTYRDSAMVVEVYAGQAIPVGTAAFSAVKDSTVTLTITLTDGWMLNEAEYVAPKAVETVKIQGYKNAPSGNPAPGNFETYKGNALIVELPLFGFYGIHLDVAKKIACPK